MVSLIVRDMMVFFNVFLCCSIPRGVCFGSKVDRSTRGSEFSQHFGKERNRNAIQLLKRSTRLLCLLSVDGIWMSVSVLVGDQSLGSGDGLKVMRKQLGNGCY